MLIRYTQAQLNLLFLWFFLFFFTVQLILFIQFINKHSSLHFRLTNSWDSKAFITLKYLYSFSQQYFVTRDTKWWSVSGVILSYSFWKQVLSCGTLQGCCDISLFKILQRPVQYLYILLPQPCLCNVCSMWYWFCCERLWKHFIFKAASHFQFSMYLFSISAANMQV